MRMEGMVRAQRYDPAGQGKQFLGAIIESEDGREWIISYSELSPYHPFADRRVVVAAEPDQPGGPQQLSGGRLAGHLVVSNLRLLEITADVELVEVGPGRQLFGRFETARNDIGPSTAAFVAENGDKFLVANDPAGAAVGRRDEVLAYPVRRSPSIPGPPGDYLWILCPHSAADLHEWRKRHS